MLEYFLGIFITKMSPTVSLDPYEENTFVIFYSHILRRAAKMNSVCVYKLKINWDFNVVSLINGISAQQDV